MIFLHSDDEDTRCYGRLFMLFIYFWKFRNSSSPRKFYGPAKWFKRRRLVPESWSPVAEWFCGGILANDGSLTFCRTDGGQPTGVAGYVSARRLQYPLILRCREGPLDGNEGQWPEGYRPLRSSYGDATDSAGEKVPQDSRYPFRSIQDGRILGVSPMKRAIPFATLELVRCTNAI